jgi:hypothetical protein
VGGRGHESSWLADLTGWPRKKPTKTTRKTGVGKEVNEKKNRRNACEVENGTPKFFLSSRELDCCRRFLAWPSSSPTYDL